MRTRLAVIIMAAISIIVSMSACQKDPVSSRKPDVVNELDNFHFTMNEVDNHDTLLIYYWRTEGSTANIDQQSVITGGRATARIVGPAPDTTETYVTDFTQNGSFLSGSSYAGTWKITVRLIGFSGMIDFRVQRR